MSGFAVWYTYPEGEREFVESYSEPRDAYDEKAKLQAQIDSDEDAEGIRVIVVEEP